MKRLNPKTNKPFQRGDIREDGWMFYGYEKKKVKLNGYHPERWADPVYFTVEKAFQSARRRAKEKNLPFNLDVEYLKSIYTKDCPVFKQPLTWGGQGKGKNNFSPSLDRIIPSIGYVKGNVAFISDKANRIKCEFEAKDLYAVADWAHEVSKKVKENVKTFSATSVPTKPRRAGKNNSQLSLVFTAGPGQNGNDIDDYRGAVQGENAYRSAKEGSGVSVGYRGQEMGAFDVFDYIESSGAFETAPRGFKEQFERLRSQFREPSLAAGTASQIRQFGD